MSASPLFQRNELLIGPEAADALARTRVILFGVGGVGSWCAEALVRSGIGRIAIVDPDVVALTNVNRQLQALPSTVGCLKVEELATRLRAINPDVEVDARANAFGIDTQDSYDLPAYDYVIDAIDSLSAKLNLVMQALVAGPTLFGTLGAGARLDPTRVRTGSLWKATGCPMGRRLRKRLRHHGVTGDYTVVFSEELLLNRGDGGEVDDDGGEDDGDASWKSPKRYVNGSMVAVTATFGMVLASLVVNDVVAKSGGLPVTRIVKRAVPAEPGGKR
jgi:tRNA A37 threonylcarbamoyladenosine dehydratase